VQGGGGGGDRKRVHEARDVRRDGREGEEERGLIKDGVESGGAVGRHTDRDGDRNRNSGSHEQQMLADGESPAEGAARAAAVAREEQGAAKGHAAVMVEKSASEGSAEKKAQEEIIRSDLLPSAQLERAFAGGASYCIFWRQAGATLQPAAAYVTPDRRSALKRARGDAKTFASESSAGALALADPSPVAICAREQRQVEGVDLGRQGLAAEFGVLWSVFIPVKGGVLEYGGEEEECGGGASSANTQRVLRAQQLLLNKRRLARVSGGSGGAAMGSRPNFSMIDAP